MRVSQINLSPLLWMVLGAGLLFGAACAQGPRLTQDAEGADVAGVSTATQGRTLTIGDISDEPVKKIERFKPLADYLASQMTHLGFTTGNVVIARDIEEMARLMEDGKVDIYMDSTFPVLKVQQLAGTDFILRRWKDGESSYYSVFVTVDANAFPSIDSLSGLVIAGEEEYSTSGYALPATQLIANGFEIEIVPGSQAAVPAGTVGVWFTRDEENTYDALENGLIKVAMFSNQDLDEVPEELRLRLVEIGRTGSVPRQIVSVSRYLDEPVSSAIAEALVALEESAAGLELLEHVKTGRFDQIPSDDRATLAEFVELVPLIP